MHKFLFIRNVSGIVQRIFAGMVLCFVIASTAKAANVQSSDDGWVFPGHPPYKSAGAAAADACTFTFNSTYTVSSIVLNSSASGNSTAIVWCARPSDGVTFQTSNIVANHVYVPGCAGYPSAVAAATNDHWLNAPITCDAPDANGVAMCHGTGPTGKPDSYQIACNGGVSGPAAGAVPAPTPDPPPSVDVNYPKCPAGTYLYTDVDGSTSCSINGINVSNTTSCGSLNYGSVNGTMVCLPPNPAPAVAKSSADAAAAKAQTAQANPGTPAAQSAAQGASGDAQRATDAANSLPTNAGAQLDAARAVAFAKQAAAYAGVPYTGPGGAINGTGGTAGTGDEGEGDDDHVTSITGDLYTKGTKTFSDVINTFSDKIKNAPMLQGTANFFNVSLGSGGCPSWMLAIQPLNVSINIGDYFCGSAMLGALNVLGIGVLVAAAFTAFRIAFL